MKYYLTHHVIDAFKNKEKFVSLNLNLSKSKIRYQGEYAILPDGYKLKYKELNLKENYVYLLDTLEDKIELIQYENSYLIWDEALKMPNILNSGELYYKIIPKPPIRLKNKLCLDLDCGLGYTSLFLIANGNKVDTIVDEKSIYFCENNPWSSAIFSKGNILREMPQRKYDCVVTYTYKLYSKEELEKIKNMLKQNGVFIYYYPYLGFHKGILKRLSELGFKTSKFKDWIIAKK